MDALKFIVWDEELVSTGARTVDLIGGKALGLHQLRAAGIRVPSWGTITAEVWRQIREGSKALTGLLSEKNESSERKAEKVRACVKQLSFSAEHDELLKQVWERISDGGRVPVAVRSSAVDEDGRTLSFAGQ